MASLLETLDADSRNMVLSEQLVQEIVDNYAKLAHGILQDAHAETDQVIAAVRLLCATRSEDVATVELIISLLEPRNSPEMQLAALQFLTASRSPQAAEGILSQWNSYSPSIRSHALDAVLDRQDLVPRLFERMRSGELKAADIDASHRLEFLRHSDATIQEQAELVFGSTLNSDRRQIVNEYQLAKNLEGRVSHGSTLFQKHCANCHKLGEVGFSVGPDLAALTNRTPSALIESIFDPNRTVEERYQAYTAIGDDGLAHTGMLMSENAASITLIEQQGKEHILLRESLETLQSTRQSLMPEGFEKDLTPQDVADLMAYFTLHAHRPKTFEGNTPAIAKPAGDGSILLRATQAEVFGNQIDFEPESKCIGNWHEQSDYVAWGISTDAEQEYEIYLEWASDDQSVGNVATIEGFDAPINAVIEGTGGYGKFNTKRIGRSRLQAGKNRIVVSSNGPMKSGPLMALRGIYLVHPESTVEKALVDQVSADQATADNALDASEAVSKLLNGLAVGSDAEYERIPQIWEQAIAAGKRNRSEEIVRLLELSLPKPGEPLQDWQSVVIGGGIINGLSSQGIWPSARIAELIGENELLRARWIRTLQLAAAMVDDESTRLGTRYDALRILGADSFERVGNQIEKYLRADVEHDLQMGAISALSDIEDDASARPILAGFAGLHPANREIAFAALLRTEFRTDALFDALEAGGSPLISLTPAQATALCEAENSVIRRRAIAHFGEKQEKEEAAAQLTN